MYQRLFTGLRGARGSEARIVFDALSDRWHRACLDGDNALHAQGLRRWGELLDAWLTACGGEVNAQNVAASVGIAETMFKLGPLLATQTLFFARPHDGKGIAEVMEYIGAAHRDYADEAGASHFGDAFGVAVFKGKRIAALCYRHENDATANPTTDPATLFLDLIQYTQQQRELRMPETGTDIFALPALLDDPAQFRRCAMALARYRSYLATLHHDIVRYLLKKHFFHAPLEREERDLLEKHYDMYVNHYDTLPAHFEKPVRFDTRNRYLLYRGDVGGAYSGCQSFCDRYPEASIADHGIIIETKLLCSVDSRATGRQYDQLDMEKRINELTTLCLRYNLFCFGDNMRLLFKRHDFLG